MNAPGSGENYMFADTAAEILEEEKEEAEKKRRLKYGLNAEAKCRFYGRNSTRRRRRDIHERDICRHPGSPHHVCEVLCVSSEASCPGAKPWEKAPDRRFTQ